MLKIFSTILFSLLSFSITNNNYSFLHPSTKLNRNLNNLSYKATYMSASDYSISSKDTIYSFLLDGGIIINDKSVNNQIIETYYDRYNYVNDYNSCVFLNNNCIDIVYFSLNYYNDDKIYLSQNNYDLYLKDILEEVDNQKNSNFIPYSSSEIIFNDTASTIIYQNNSTTKMCSYSIQTLIERNFTSISNGIEIGNYNLKTTLLINAESIFSVTDYSVECNLQKNISYSSSKVTDMSQNQNISESKNNNIITINSEVTSDNYGEKTSLSENINFSTLNDKFTSTFSTKLTSLTLKDNGWWIFQKKYPINDNNKCKLLINWDNDGLISYEITN